MSEMQPRWKHDCDKCRFIAAVLDGNRVEDWYVCDSQGYRTTIGRFGDEGENYVSVPEMVLAKDEPYVYEDKIGGQVLVGQHIIAREILRRSRERSAA